MCGLNKFVDNFDFKSFLSNYDIIILCETWSKFKGECDNFLSCYVHFDFVRNMKINSIRNSGGVSVFIKSNLAKLNITRRLYDEYCVLYCILSYLHCLPMKILSYT